MADFRLFGRNDEYPQLPLLVWWAANIFFYGFGEEVGWRGFALPRLQKKYNALTATAVLSIFWTIWHLSLFWFNPGYMKMGMGEFMGLSLSFFLGAVIFTWLYKSTNAILILRAFGALQVWRLYVAAVFQGLGNTFQWPAYSAASSVMLNKKQYGRAKGMMSLIEAGPGVVAPLLAGALLPIVGLTGILFIDVATFLLAIGTLLLVFIHQPPRTAEGAEGQGSFWKKAAFGFQYIFARPGLMGLLSIFLLCNLFSGIQLTLLAPMILSRTGNNSLIFGSVQSAGAFGGIIGSVLMSVWDGFKRQIHGVLLGWIFASTVLIFTGIGRDLPVWIPAIVIGVLFFPIVNGSSQAIWQAKLAPDLQGRVFSFRRLIAWVTNPITPIIAGRLADRVMEPAMQTVNPFSNLFGGLVGTGPGSRMGLLTVMCSVVCILVGVGGYFVPAIRNVEDDLPDHDELQKRPFSLTYATHSNYRRIQIK